MGREREQERSRWGEEQGQGPRQASVFEASGVSEVAENSQVGRVGEAGTCGHTRTMGLLWVPQGALRVWGEGQI